MLIKTKQGVVIKKSPMHIGVAHKLKAACHSDSETGVFWQRYPDYSADTLKLQKALLNHV